MAEKYLIRLLVMYNLSDRGSFCSIMKISKFGPNLRLQYLRVGRQLPEKQEVSLLCDTVEGLNRTINTDRKTHISTKL